VVVCEVSHNVASSLMAVPDLEPAALDVPQNVASIVMDSDLEVVACEKPPDVASFTMSVPDSEPAALDVPQDVASSLMGVYGSEPAVLLVDTNFPETDGNLTLTMQPLTCEFLHCGGEIYIACPSCLRALCYDHMETGCVDHTASSTLFYIGNDGQVLLNVEEPPSSLSYCNKVGITGSKRTKTPNNWKRNIAKSKSNSGEEYITTGGKLKPQRMIKPCPCKKKCQYNCCSWSDEERSALFKGYWELSCKAKRDWIVSHTKLLQVKAQKSDKRNVTVAYFMEKDSHNAVQVCKQFFAATLDIGQRLISYTVMRRTKISTSAEDKRGKHRPHNKTADAIEDGVIKFISSLPAVPSHYCRSRTSRQYLPSELKSVNKLYTQYTNEKLSNKEPIASKNFFYRTFTSKFNIGFHVPKKDKCISCEKFKNTPEELKNEEVRKQHQVHEDEKNATYVEHIADQMARKTDPTVLCCSFDLEAVLNTPHGESVLLFYSRKYTVYNFTVYESVTRKGFCYIWGEADGKRGSTEIATCLHKWLLDVDGRNDGTKHVILYCDCCSGQNRNRTVLAMLKHTLSQLENIQEITLKFLLSGHSYMPADSMHACIERFIKKRIVWAPSEWTTIMSCARVDPEPYEVNVMTCTDFLNWAPVEGHVLPKQLKDDSLKNVKWLSVRKIHLRKDCDVIEMKYSFSNEAQPVLVSLAKTRTRRKSSHSQCGVNVVPTQLYENRLAITTKKYNDLERLCTTGAIPRMFHQEYLSLPVDETVEDCLAETDEEDP
jgi:hypothetical protein